MDKWGEQHVCKWLSILSIAERRRLCVIRLLRCRAALSTHSLKTNQWHLWLIISYITGNKKYFKRNLYTVKISCPLLKNIRLRFVFSYSMVNDQSAVNTEAGKKGLAHLKLLQYRQSKCFQEESQLLVIVNTLEIITVTTSLFRKTGAAAAQNVVCMFDMLLSYMFSRCRPCARMCVSRPLPRSALSVIFCKHQEWSWTLAQRGAKPKIRGNLTRNKTNLAWSYSLTFRFVCTGVLFV